MTHAYLAVTQGQRQNPCAVFVRINPRLTSPNVIKARSKNRQTSVHTQKQSNVSDRHRDKG